jgi:hypothetical protein
MERHRPARADEVEVALDRQPRAVRPGLDAARAERDRRAPQDLLVDRLGDARLVVVAQRMQPAAPVADPQRAGVGGQGERALGVVLRQVERRVLRGDLDHEIVPGLRRRAGPSGAHRERPVAGPELVAPGRDRHAAQSR